MRERQGETVFQERTKVNGGHGTTTVIALELSRWAPGMLVLS